MPGQAESSVTVILGYGRRRAGRVGNGVGVDVYPLRTSDAPWFGAGLEVVKTGRRHQLAQTQHHFNDGGPRPGPGRRPRRRTASKPDFAKMHEQDHAAGERGESLFENPEPQAAGEEGEGNAWGMAINLNTCIGCSACVMACQAENNIPVVGKEQVLASPRDALDPHRPLLRGRRRGRIPDIHFQPRGLHALREGPVRGRLPGRRRRRTAPRGSTR